MEYTKFPRELIYYDRLSLDEFGIDKDKSLNHEIYEQLLRLKCIVPTKEETEQLILKIFNDVYYILTLAFIEKRPVFQIENYIAISKKDRYYLMSSEKESIIFSILCIFLNIRKETFNSNQMLLLEKVSEHAKYCISNSPYCNVSLPESRYNEFNLVENVFYPRSMMRGASQIDWKKMTNNFNPDDIRNIVTNIGRGSDEKKAIIRAIYDAKTTSNTTDPDSSIPSSVDDLLNDLYKEYNWFHLGFLDSNNDNSETLNLETNMAQERISQPKHEINQFAKEKAEVENRCRKLEEENEKLRTDYENAQMEKQQLVEKMAELQKQLSENADIVVLSRDIKIAEDRKIDVIKILHAMCKIGLFQLQNGSNIPIKAVMEYFGKMLNDNFSGYSSNLSVSKDDTKEDTFMQVFEDLSKKAKEYYNKS
jgi:hypothetical protein